MRTTPAQPGTSNLPPGLYVVATPIGNLEDLSPRGRRVLAGAALVAAEDTRTSGRLAHAAGGSARLLSLTEHNTRDRIPALLAAASASPVALVSDAGTPGVSDPGARVVEAAHAAGIPVFAVAGPSALAAAISVSGFEGDVHFLGFLPRQKGERLALLARAASTASNLAFFESPRRLAATLRELVTAFDDPEVTVSRELTKLHEETIRGHASQLATRFAATLGECTVILRVPPRRPASAGEGHVAAYLAEMRRAGARRAAAAAEAARRFGIPRNDAYRLWNSGD